MAPKTILVVDDEPLIADFLRQVLNFHNHQVETALDAETALELFSKFHYDLVITDYLMPGIDGFQLAQEIRQRAPRQPILMLTGHPEPLYNVTRHLHVNAVLRKPCSFEQLEAVMLEIFRSDQPSVHH